MLRAMSRLAPDNIKIVLYQELDSLPHFNPDLDSDGNTPLSVANLRRQIQSANGVLISSPEYAHGVPGALKNALDWLVSSGELVGKPFALINASSRAQHAQEQLAEILRTMAANIVEESSITIPFLGKNLNEAEILENIELSSLLRSAITKFVGSIKDAN